MTTRFTRLARRVTPAVLASAAAAAVVLSGATPAQAIVNGGDATRAYASVVMIHLQQDDGTFKLKCAGSVIGYRGQVGVLTNAQCGTPFGELSAFPADRLKVTAGTTPDRIHGREITVTDVRPAAGWDWGRARTRRPTRQGVRLRRAPAGRPPQPAPDRHVLGRSGHDGPAGRTGNTAAGQPAAVLQQLDGAQVVDPAQCANILISDGEICVRPVAGTNLGAGDGGSPALIRVNGRLLLAGTASRTGCTCTERLVSVYTDPAANRDEIVQLLTGRAPTRATGRGGSLMSTLTCGAWPLPRSRRATAGPAPPPPPAPPPTARPRAVEVSAR